MKDSAGYSLGIKIVLYVVAILVTSYIASTAFSMMNQPSDMSVTAGVAILLVLFFGWFTHIFKKVRGIIKKTEKAKKKRNGVKNVKNTVLAVAMICVSLSAAGCSGCVGCTVVGPGYAGIKVNMTGDNRGVDKLPIETGYVWYNPFTQSVFEYPTFVQTAIWTQNPKEGSPNDESITFNSQEGLVISGDISLSYQLDYKMVPAFYVKFRNDDLNGFTHGYLHNVARDAFNEIGATYTVDQIYGEKKDELLRKVVQYINAHVQPFGVTIVQFGFIGALRLPQGVVDALNAKIQATQNAMRVQNEVLMAQAEAQKSVAKAQGEAKSNQILTASITPQLLEWRRLQITEEAVQRWNGARPLVEGSGSGMLLQIPMPNQR